MYRIVAELEARKTQTLGKTSTSAAEPSPALAALSGTRRKVAEIHDSATARVLERWSEQERKWERVNERLAAVVGREVADTVFNRVHDNRRRKEQAELLDRAVPLTEKFIDSQWLMSLRNNWTRYTPLGNIFSGLFISAEENMLKETPMEMVGRPAGSLGPRLAASMARSTIRSRARRRGWEGSEHLKTRRAQYAKGMSRVLPYEPEIDGLFVQGSSLEDTFYRRATHEVTAEDVEQFLFTADPTRFGALRMHSLRGAIPEEEESRASEPALEAPAVVPGPSATLSAHHLSLSCMRGGVAQGSLTLHNAGTTALYFDWMQVAQPGPLTAEDVAAPLTQVVSTGAFVIAPIKGALLPGKSQTFRVTFTALEPGTVLEHWNLETRPRIPERIHRVTFRGLSVVEDTNQLGRRAVVAKMGESEKERAVIRAVDRILENVAMTVDAPVPHAAVPGYDIDRLVAFMDRNNAAAPDLFYDPVALHEFQALFASFRDVVQSVLAERKKRKEDEEAAAAAETTTKAKGAAAKASDKKKGAAPEEIPVAPEPTLLAEFPAEWDGSLATMHAAAAALASFVEQFDAKEQEAPAAMAAAEASRHMASRMPELLNAMRFPPSHDGLVARAIRDELLRLADEVETKSEQVMQAMGPLSFSYPEDDEGMTEEEVEELRREEEERAAKVRQQKWRTKAIQACRKLICTGLTEELFTRVEELECAVKDAIYEEMKGVCGPSGEPETAETQWRHAKWIQRARTLLPPEVLEGGEEAPAASAEPSSG